MKLLVQIPCYNEEQNLPQVLQGIPKTIEGIEQIEILVIDDGSSDNTSLVARNYGAHHLIRNKRNLGLAHTFRKGLDACLRAGADIIVNIDGDNQYNGSDIPKLIQPIVEGRADMVVGDRQTDTIMHFSPLKRILQKVGSSLVRSLSRTSVRDTVSGFRAFSREAALKLTILSNYTYTLESILQAGAKGLLIDSIPIQTNHVLRKSRLIRSLRSYLAFSAATIIRIFTMYNPLRVFVDIGGIFILISLALAARFLYFYFFEVGRGLIQSLIFAAAFASIGMMILLVGVLADLIQFNRRLLEEILERVRKLELDTAKRAPPKEL